MEDYNNGSRQHSLILDKRRFLTITGIKDVDRFDEENIVVILDNCDLTVKGSSLHISKISVETGDLTVEGEITSLTYSGKAPTGNLIQRLFR